MELKRIIKEELLRENARQHLEMYAKMTSGNQKIYYDYQLNNLEVVPVVNHLTNERLKEKVASLIKKMSRFGSESFCQKKGCFDTAYSTTMYLGSENIHYIEGYVDSIIPIVHAWNYLPSEGIYFDLMNDIAWADEDSHFNKYYKIIDFDRSEVTEWSSITGYAGGYLESPQYIKHIVDENK